MDPIEWFGAITGLVAVALTVRQSAWSWPIGLLNCAAYVWVFAQARFYSDVVLQGYFLVTGVIGWWRWARPTDDAGSAIATLPVGRATAGELGVGALIVVTVSAVWGGGLARYTDAAYPYVDSATMAASLVAQWWMTRKVLESWVIWIAADVVMVAMYASKGLVITSGLYVLFTGLAIAGLASWWREAR